MADTFHYFDVGNLAEIISGYCYTASIFDHWQQSLSEDIWIKRWHYITPASYLMTKLWSRFQREANRYNYITPASYLELIHTFEKLFKSKTEAIRAYKNRYIMGLQKLDFAATQVSCGRRSLLCKEYGNSTLITVVLIKVNLWVQFSMRRNTNNSHSLHLPLVALYIWQLKKVLKFN